MALAAYGCVCSRCGEWGNDVHHKTYERVGGNEILEDLEVMCRECHEAHHALDKMATNKRTRRRTIARRAIYEKLTARHCMALWNKYKNIKTRNDLFIEINRPGINEVAEDAALMLGCELLSNGEANAFSSFCKGHNKKIHFH